MPCSSVNGVEHEEFPRIEKRVDQASIIVVGKIASYELGEIRNMAQLAKVQIVPSEVLKGKPEAGNLTAKAVAFPRGVALPGMPEAEELLKRYGGYGTKDQGRLFSLYESMKSKDHCIFFLDCRDRSCNAFYVIPEALIQRARLLIKASADFRQHEDRIESYFRRSTISENPDLNRLAVRCLLETRDLGLTKQLLAELIQKKPDGQLATYSLKQVQRNAMDADAAQRNSYLQLCVDLYRKTARNDEQKLILTGLYDLAKQDPSLHKSFDTALAESKSSR